MSSARLKVRDEVGLHARPAAMFVECANRFEAEIEVRNLSTTSDWVNAKSILGVLTLGVKRGHEIELRVSGADEEQAVVALTALVVSDFNAVA